MVKEAAEEVGVSDVVPKPKLTRAQKEFLAIIAERRHKCSTNYRPAVALVSLGLAERLTQRGMFVKTAIFAITDAGRAALSQPDGQKR